MERKTLMNGRVGALGQDYITFSNNVMYNLDAARAINFLDVLRGRIQTQWCIPRRPGKNTLAGLDHKTRGWAVLATKALPILNQGPLNTYLCPFGQSTELLHWKIYWDRKVNPPKDPLVFLQPQISWYGVVWKGSALQETIQKILRS